jgi:hypothetical protein
MSLVRLLAVAVAPLLLADVARGAPPQSAAVTASPRGAGVRPAALTLRLSYEMQCGYPGPGPVVVRFPTAEHVPASIPRPAVLVNGKPTSAVNVAGHVVSVALPPRPQVMCDSIGPGTLTLAFTRGAGLGNPARRGTYTVTAIRQASAFAARLAIGG